jgi:predicted Zn-dependent protease
MRQFVAEFNDDIWKGVSLNRTAGLGPVTRQRLRQLRIDEALVAQVAQAKSAHNNHAQQKTDPEQNSRKDRKKAQKSVSDTSFLPNIAEEKSEALAEAIPAAKNDPNLDNKAEAIQNETTESIMFRKFDAFVDDAVFSSMKDFRLFLRNH